MPPLHVAVNVSKNSKVILSLTRKQNHAKEGKNAGNRKDNDVRSKIGPCIRMARGEDTLAAPQ
jgi:hypothetical protein